MLSLTNNEQALNHQYKQNPRKLLIFSLRYALLVIKNFQHCDLILLKCEFHKLSTSISVPWNFRILM